MSLPSLPKLYDVLEATWPAASCSDCGPFTIRDGQQGGKRVCAATAEDVVSEKDIPTAEAAMQALGQDALFMVRAQEDAFDQTLAQAGYEVIDPVNIYVARAEDLATELPPRTVAIPAWGPLKIMEEIWARGGIGLGRINVMHRACSPKAGLINRWQDKPAGTSFIAMHDDITMLHALEILPEFRRAGLGRWAMRRAAFWTLQHGGEYLSVICTVDNEAANALYKGLGMTCQGRYHYRIKSELN